MHLSIALVEYVVYATLGKFFLPPLVKRTCAIAVQLTVDVPVSKCRVKNMRISAALCGSFHPLHASFVTYATAPVTATGEKTSERKLCEFFLHRFGIKHMTHLT